jgi:hypothetical protein
VSAKRIPLRTPRARPPKQHPPQFEGKRHEPLLPSLPVHFHEQIVKIDIRTAQPAQKTERERWQSDWLFATRAG